MSSQYTCQFCHGVGTRDVLSSGYYRDEKCFPCDGLGINPNAPIKVRWSAYFYDDQHISRRGLNEEYIESLESRVSELEDLIKNLISTNLYLSVGKG